VVGTRALCLEGLDLRVRGRRQHLLREAARTCSPVPLIWFLYRVEKYFWIVALALAVSFTRICSAASWL
jgi:hypothetical protein